MRVFEDNLLGRKLPFFLNNFNLTGGYYLYEIFSPRCDNDLNPLVSLTKLAEKTTRPEVIPGKDIDLLATCMGTRKVDGEKGVEFLNSLLKKENPIITKGDKNGDFPFLQLSGPVLVKTAVVALRNANRMKNYRFWGGKKIDLLWTPEEYAVFNVCEDETHYWFEPEGLYMMNDLEMKNPLKIKVNYSPDGYKFQKNPGGKALGEMLHHCKILEWRSFDRKPLHNKYHE